MFSREPSGSRLAPLVGCFGVPSMRALLCLDLLGWTMIHFKAALGLRCAADLGRDSLLLINVHNISLSVKIVASVALKTELVKQSDCSEGSLTT